TAPGRSGHGGELAILKAVAALGKAIGVEVTAEGVETEEQLRQVIAAGCDSVQGFLVSQPVAPALIQDAARLGGAVLDRVRASRRWARARPGAGVERAAARCSSPSARPGPSLPPGEPEHPQPVAVGDLLERVLVVPGVLQRHQQSLHAGDVSY